MRLELWYSYCMEAFFEFDPLSTGTKGLVYIGDEILVYRRDNNTSLWPLSIDLPGGGREDDETPFETFGREVYEEFDLTIPKDAIVYTKRYTSTIVEGKFGHFAVAKLGAEQKHHIRLGNEGIEYMIMTLPEYLDSNDAWPIFQERALDYQKALGLS